MLQLKLGMFACSEYLLCYNKLQMCTRLPGPRPYMNNKYHVIISQVSSVSAIYNHTISVVVGDNYLFQDVCIR